MQSLLRLGWRKRESKICAALSTVSVGIFPGICYLQVNARDWLKKCKLAWAKAMLRSALSAEYSVQCFILSPYTVYSIDVAMDYDSENSLI